jgi:hypothetical protein
MMEGCNWQDAHLNEQKKPLQASPVISAAGYFSAGKRR